MPPIPEEISAMILENSHGVLATSFQDVPHASLMAYAVRPDLEYIHMATSARTRKWANLLANPRMALLLDDRGNGGEGPTKALTIGGDQVNVAGQAEQAEIASALLARHPHLEGLLSQEDIRIIRLKPRWCLFLKDPEHSVFINF
ncbi:pyridoxamine 5'-phosphate oxidase family protein [Fundidesulfovibrio agrisoli]|uniref:pyridoxamine 5'-phosphate oxidase family protein n=1 Tax=Fundidesulfovibrio agrisoli TaxID=2922717 RepID=UPI001FACD191|nr:pyridoxamine 5'-phosphate oxidase family protein [Fundidesulfovibrio agrisoli]